ncbi:DegT/DnrJ/EryC1/StrS family aminotransferase [Acetobacteroides hydrogenigenes]|uniref:dTDP-4-amino-4,6-dideoxygalactose transaminase n=1 Tax=Acetobacteroides hydrogenigenes TaxID=979970 RepID=A0A4R2E648_9BACT|nr:DegT/DnrJ/EryC1/StrS family aminotransferase [Acetobacteroides hydrogenigenes]TCN62196.1 dTDP-4-amino-4,6-dideoxygalactose transaminase [Acetobacteroides hydrogenigenes]
MAIVMCDLKGQYDKIKDQIETEINKVLSSTSYINGAQVKNFENSLKEYTGAKHVIACANGTDALQIALMALDLQPGDEVIVPAFTYVASAEVIGLLKLTPVMVDVDYSSFNVTVKNIEKAITPRTKAIIPVHLFGQCCDMEPIMELAKKHNIYVIEDNAQAIGATYTFSNGEKKQTGTIGDIGCTSFFPSKNLGCYGDGGALMTNNDELAQKIRMIANHGQKVKYHHEVIGCNSRLDTIQAAILNVKLKYLNDYSNARYNAAQVYHALLNDVDGVTIPDEMPFSTHVYHQYTLKVKDGKRDMLKKHLEEQGIPSMIYYPLPLQKQNAFKSITIQGEDLDVSELLADSVLSLPIHTEITKEEQVIISNAINEFFKN